MKINTTNWKEYTINEIFDCQTTKPFLEERISGKTPYITRTTSDNGCDSFISEEKEYINKGKCITIGAEGLYAFYQPNDFIAGVKIYTLRNDKITKNNALFICTLLNASVFKYSYGRARILEKIKNETIKLPYKQDGSPDWDYMEEYMKTLHHKPLKPKKECLSMLLDTSEWKEFRLDSLFTIKKGKRLTSEDQIDGDNIYIGAIDSNNGVANYIAQTPIHSGNTISLSYNGSVGEAFYQADPYWATDDVNALYFKQTNEYEFNKYIGLFICSILKKEKYRFSYGRKWTLDNMEKSVIKLPIKKDGSPDWEWMEQYIKSLPMAEYI